MSATKCKYDQTHYDGADGTEASICVYCERDEIINIIENGDNFANTVAYACNDTHHDNRSCPTCESRWDGIDDYRRKLAEKIKSIGKGK